MRGNITNLNIRIDRDKKLIIITHPAIDSFNDSTLHKTLTSLGFESIQGSTIFVPMGSSKATNEIMMYRLKKIERILCEHLSTDERYTNFAKFYLTTTDFVTHAVDINDNEVELDNLYLAIHNIFGSMLFTIIDSEKYLLYIDTESKVCISTKTIDFDDFTVKKIFHKKCDTVTCFSDLYELLEESVD